MLLFVEVHCRKYGKRLKHGIGFMIGQGSPNNIGVNPAKGKKAADTDTSHSDDFLLVGSVQNVSLSEYPFL